MDAGHRRAFVGLNQGIVSLGDAANNTVTNYRYPLPRPADTPWPGGPGRLSPNRLVPGQFVGREGELRELHEGLRSGTGLIAQAVAGLGGVGKSALAAHYTELHRGDYGPVWWIAADGPEQIEAGLAALAVRLVPELSSAPAPDAAAWARSWLGCHDGWLLVLDDVTAPEHVRELVGELGGGRFLITSRLVTGWQELAARPVRLAVLPAADSVELLRRAAGRAELPDADRLCERLGHLPLAVRLAGAFLARTGIGVSEYLELLEDSRPETFRSAGVGTPEDRTVAMIWAVTFDRIAAEDPLAPELLGALAWFAPTRIPRRWLGPMGSKLEVIAAVGLLSDFCMIEVEDDAISMHSLVQEVLRTPGLPYRDEAGIRRSRAGAVQLLAAALPALPTGVTGTEGTADPDAWRQLLPHADAVIARTSAGQDDRYSMQVFDAVATYLGSLQLQYRAGPYCERIVEYRDRTLGRDDPRTLAARTNLASAYLEAGKGDRAVELLSANLADQERVLGADDYQVLMTRQHLAGAYARGGDRRAGIALMEANLADFERVLGPDHLSTLIARGNLAAAYHDGGDRAKALVLLKEGAARAERVLGPDHFDTLWARGTLAIALYQAGETGAVALLERNREDCERVLGPDHPHTEYIRSNLAAAGGGTAGRRSIEEIRAQLTALQAERGPDHPLTLRVRVELATAYGEAGDADAAVDLLETGYAYSLRLFGREHQNTLDVAHRLGEAHRVAGRRAVALELVGATLVVCERVLGTEDEATVNVRATLVYLSAAELAGRFPGARTVRRLIGAVRRSSRRSSRLTARSTVGAAGEEYRRIRVEVAEGLVRGMAAEGLRLCELGRLEEAEGYLRFAADDRYPPALANLGLLLAHADRPAEAMHWLARAVEAGETGAGGLLGSILLEQGRAVEAEPWLRRAAEEGDLNAMTNLGLVLFRSRRREEAVQWYRRAAGAGDREAAAFLALWDTRDHKGRPPRRS